MGSGASAEKSATAQPAEKSRSTYNETSIVTKAKEVATGAAQKDSAYHGFNVETKVKIDFSVPTNAVEGALLILNTVLKLIQAYQGRSQLIKALRSRTMAIDQAVSKLRGRSLDAAGKALENLCQILEEFQAFVEYITTKPVGFFEKTIDFFRAKSDLENLGEYDALITRALADLTVPLQTEALLLQEQQMKELQHLSGQVAKVLDQMKDQKLLALSKKCLTNENAMTFWFECFPDKFQVPVPEFTASFRVWIQETKVVTCSKSQAARIIAAINMMDPEDDAPDMFIDAREVNAMFECLPGVIHEGSFDSAIDAAAVGIQEATRKCNEEREAARQRVAAMQANTTKILPAEQRLLDKEAGRFCARFVVSSFQLGRPKGAGIDVMYIFEGGEMYLLGTDVSNQPILWIGAIAHGFTFVMQNFSAQANDIAAITDTDRQTAQVIGGVYKRNSFCAVSIVNDDLFSLQMVLEIRPWAGYFDQQGRKGDMVLSMVEVTPGNFVGFSDDEVGTAIWKGTISKETGECNLVKKYLGMHFVEYKGNTTVKDGRKTIRGTWAVGTYTGDFLLYEL